MQIQKIALYGLEESELMHYCKEHWQAKPFHGKQIFQWLHHKGVREIQAMTNLPLWLRDRLNKEALTSTTVLRSRHVSEDGTEKWVFELKDQALIESVVIPSVKRVTLCISSQVGCAMGCRFCRTGQMGLMRHLSVSEIVEQVAWAKQIWELEKHRRITNIVFMGMGEPLHNIEAVIPAIRILMHPHGMDFSKRKITVSTVGWIPGLRQLSEEGLGVNLAISLSAASNALRSEIMPVNRKFNLELLKEALTNYPLSPRQRFTFEYVMLKGVNDQIKHAKQLVKWLHGLPSKVNLIPWNAFEGAPFESSTGASIESFQQYLLSKNIHTTIRASRGQENMAACGLLGRGQKH